MHPDLASLNPEVTRRDVLTSALAAGFALAVLPIRAETITTDAQGLSAGAIEVTFGYDSFPAYRAMPAQGGPFPVVLVVQEIFGVHEYIKDVCRRLAKQGYLAIAPELFARQGDVSKLQSIDDILKKVVAQVPDKQVMKDLDDCVRWAAANQGDTRRVAVTGFCYGGRITWLYCAHNTDVKCGVAWYGRLSGQATENQPKFPREVVESLRAPVLGLYGGKDAGIPVSDVEAMRSALQGAKKLSEIVLYPNAQHGFHADYRKSYDEAAAQDGWKRMLAWFKQHNV